MVINRLDLAAEKTVTDGKDGVGRIVGSHMVEEVNRTLSHSRKRLRIIGDSYLRHPVNNHARGTSPVALTQEGGKDDRELKHFVDDVCRILTSLDVATEHHGKPQRLEGGNGGSNLCLAFFSQGTGHASLEDMLPIFLGFTVSIEVEGHCVKLKIEN